MNGESLDKYLEHKFYELNPRKTNNPKQLAQSSEGLITENDPQANEVKLSADSVKKENEKYSPYRSKALMRLRDDRIKRENTLKNSKLKRRMTVENDAAIDSDSDEHELEMNLSNPNDNTGEVNTQKAHEMPKPTAAAASTNREWDPVSAARQYLYDSEKKVPLAPDVIKENLQKVFKNKNKINVNTWLELASKCSEEDSIMESICLGSAWTSIMVNRLLQLPTNTTLEDGKKISSAYFSINPLAAAANRVAVRLPSGVSAYIPTMVASSLVNSLVSNDIDHITRTVTNAVMSNIWKSDPFAPCYCAPKVKEKDYIPIENALLDEITGFICEGLNIKPDNDESQRLQKIRVFNLSRQTVTNYIERHRQTYNKRHGERASILLAEKLRALRNSSEETGNLKKSGHRTETDRDIGQQGLRLENNLNGGETAKHTPFQDDFNQEEENLEIARDEKSQESDDNMSDNEIENNEVIPNFTVREEANTPRGYFVKRTSTHNSIVTEETKRRANYHSKNGQSSKYEKKLADINIHKNVQRAENRNSASGKKITRADAYRWHSEDSDSEYGVPENEYNERSPEKMERNMLRRQAKKPREAESNVMDSSMRGRGIKREIDSSPEKEKMVSEKTRRVIVPDKQALRITSKATHIPRSTVRRALRKRGQFKME